MKNGRFRKWDRFELTYSIWNYNPDLQRDQQVTAIRWAFDLWSESTSLQFERIRDGVAADIEFRWVDEPGGDHAWASPPPRSSGQEPEDGNVWFNLDRRWTFEQRDTQEEPLDFLTLCAHEVGHSIGLGHVQMVDSLMRSPYVGSIRNLGLYELSCYTQLYEPHLNCAFFPDEAPRIRCR
jgi:hypothetical protein